MQIQGIGIVFARGRGIAALERALEEGWTAPDSAAYRVDLSGPGNHALFRTIRRADRFIRLAVLAATDAVHDADVDLKDKHRVGIILASGFGPHVTTFKFLDDIIQYGDTGVSPIVFSHSVHNAAASYIAQSLDVRGPVHTVTQFSCAVHHAFDLARIWLAEDRCQHVLVGSAEECGTVMDYICRGMLHIAEDGKIRPFAFSKSPLAVPGEGAVFYLVTNQNNEARYCRVSIIQDAKPTEPPPSADLILVDADGMAHDESCYREAALSDALIAGYSPLFGSMLIGSAFNCAVAALMLRKQTQFASPIRENPHGVRICATREARFLNRICCIKYGCGGRRAVLHLRRSVGP